MRALQASDCIKFDNILLARGYHTDQPSSPHEEMDPPS